MVITEPAEATCLACSTKIYSINGESFSRTPKLSKREKGFLGWAKTSLPYKYSLLRIILGNILKPKLNEIWRKEVEIYEIYKKLKTYQAVAQAHSNSDLPGKAWKVKNYNYWIACRHLDCESGSERLCYHEELRGFTDLGSASYWMEICFNHSEELTRSG